MTTEGAKCRLGRLGLVGLLVAVGIAGLAPVVAGLHRSGHGYASVRLEPGASVPLSANSEVALDSGDGQTRIGGCSIAGPGAWSRQIVAAASTTDFRTGPDGDYKITCQGGAVEVENTTTRRSFVDPQQERGHRTAVVMFAVAGLVGVASLAVLVMSSRARGPLRTGDAPSRVEADSDSGERDPH